MQTLHGVGWDHPRCLEPMRAAAERLRQERVADLTWSFRSLAAFNDQPLGDLAAGVDLVVIDHPHVPGGARRGELKSFDAAAAPDDLASATQDYIGMSADSYRWDDEHWALPVDVACQLAVSARDVDVPETWEELLDFSAEQPQRVGVPLYPSDAFCLLMTRATARGVELTHDLARAREGRLAEDRRGLIATIQDLVDLARHVHPASFGAQPPKVYQLLRDGEVSLVPATFGYATWSMERPRTLRFGHVPGSQQSGGVLGGAGLAISAASRQPRLAAAVATKIASDAYGTETLVPAGGQPASTAVWESGDADRQLGGFLAATRNQTRQAFVRPRTPWWPRVHKRLGEVLGAALSTHTQADDLCTQMEKALAGVAQQWPDQALSDVGSKGHL